MQALEEVLARACEEAAQARDTSVLDEVRVRYLGKQGTLTGLLRELGKLPAEQRPEAGKRINEAKLALQSTLDERRTALDDERLNEVLERQRVDVTLPGRREQRGGVHPISHTMDRVAEYFGQIGFEVAHGPEVEDDFHNFEALNIPPQHPARAMQDTFYFGDGRLLRKLPRSSAPLSWHLGILGMPGMTAYVGLMKIGDYALQLENLARDQKAEELLVHAENLPALANGVADWSEQQLKAN